MFAFVIFGIIKVQYFEYSKNKAFLDQILSKTYLEKGLRGSIVSSDGVKIAWSEKVPYLVVKKYSADLEKELSKYLSTEQLSLLRLNGKVEINSLQAFTLKSKGFDITFNEIRKSFGGEFYHIVGNLNTDRIGVSGLEYVYEDVLKGRVGISYALPGVGSRDSSNVLKTIPENGLDIETTINYGLQKYAYELLTEIATPSVIIVSNVKTGDILAMVSYPSPEYDLNNTDYLEWKKLLSDPLTPLMNRAISGLYPPGSTYKVITAFADQLFGSIGEVYCTGVYHYRDTRGNITGTYRDWLPSGHGRVDIVKALRVSCNVYFYTAGLNTGIDNLVKVARAFYIDKKTGINIPGEVENVIPTPEWKEKFYKEKWYPGNTIVTSIGQGYVSMTPLSVLFLYNTIANRGIFVKPKLVVNEPTEEKKIKLDIPEKVWDTIIKGLTEVTTVVGSAANGGTAAKSFTGFPYKVAGKTGTAQNPKGAPHAWFVGFAPVDDPQYSVLVLIEHGESGGLFAAPVARKVFDYLYENNFFEEKSLENN